MTRVGSQRHSEKKVQLVILDSCLILLQRSLYTYLFPWERMHMRNILSILVTVPVDKLVINNIVTAYLIIYSPIYIYIYIYIYIFHNPIFLEGLRGPTTSRSDCIKSDRNCCLYGMESFLLVKSKSRDQEISFVYGTGSFFNSVHKNLLLIYVLCNESTSL